MFIHGAERQSASAGHWAHRVRQPWWCQRVADIIHRPRPIANLCKHRINGTTFFPIDADWLPIDRNLCLALRKLLIQRIKRHWTLRCFKYKKNMKKNFCRQSETWTLLKTLMASFVMSFYRHESWNLRYFGRWSGEKKQSPPAYPILLTGFRLSNSSEIVFFLFFFIYHFRPVDLILSLWKKKKKANENKDWCPIK